MKKPTPAKFTTKLLFENQKMWYLKPHRRSERAHGAAKANEAEGAGKEFFGLGVSINPWKGSFRPRKSKEIQDFFFDSLCRAWLNLGRFGFGLE
jgi:hypothetical protein